MSNTHDRCGKCATFPGNGNKCKLAPEKGKIYMMDYACKNFKKGV